ncbi:MAG: citrate lyase acyl carrier protein [Bacilli bacterium]|jgi:citrate lyase subunit gamma (acyl carrier protein)|nr:citrate lyase acyl carrier protein [Bacilli bacterium]
MIKNSVAGTLESNDVMIEIMAHDQGRLIELDSPVKDMFENDILKVINDVLDEFKIDDIRVVIKDQGALDYALAARLRTALKRGML